MHLIDVQSGLLANNDAVAAENRAMLAKRGIYAANVMSAPGAGKTSLLERLLPLLAAKFRVAVEATPEEIAANPNSHTGRYLKIALT